MKKEFSKMIVVTAVLIAVFNIIVYWIAVFKDLNPDSTMPVSSMVQIFGAILSYCLYQLGLKNSRNKYGIDANGQPFKLNDSSSQYDSQKHIVATRNGLEPSTSCVTGRRSNQLNYRATTLASGIIRNTGLFVKY